jgi:hypothetical protein
MDTRARVGNLGTEVQNAQLRRGVILFAIALAIGVILVRAQVAPAVRLLLFVPFAMASYGIHLGLFKTCGIMAIKGARSMDGCVEPICDKSERGIMLRQGLKVIASTFAAATLATLLLVLLP